MVEQTAALMVDYSAETTAGRWVAQMVVLMVDQKAGELVVQMVD